MNAWLTCSVDRALLIQADYGVGKSAFVAELIEQNPGNAIVAHHCCQHDTPDTLSPAWFVWSVAAQLAKVFPAYAAQVEGQPELQAALDQAAKDAASAFERAVLSPLSKLDAPIDGAKCLVIDSLDESLEFDGAQGQQKTGHIVELLAARARRLPKWLRVLATTRDRREVSAPIHGSFATTNIDAEGQDNIEDLRNYVRGRASTGVVGEKLSAAGMPADSLANVLKDKSGGKFLYAVFALDDLQRGTLNISDIPNLPPGMDGFYLDAFKRRFDKVKRDYALTGAVLGLIAAAREPMSREDMADVLAKTEIEIQTALSSIGDFLAARNKRYAFAHLSLGEWITGEDEKGEPRAGDYYVSVRAAQAQLAAWGQREAEGGTAHERDYLVRHLVAHLSDSARAIIFAHLLLDIRWLQRKLTLQDVNALLDGFHHVQPEPALMAIELALRQSAHTLRRQDSCIYGPHQLPAQLLARLLHRSEPSIQTVCESVETYGKTTFSPWMRPLAASLRASGALLHTLYVGKPNFALAVLPDGRLASGSGNEVLDVWDMADYRLDATIDGCTTFVAVLAVLPDGRLALGLHDGTIKLWNPVNGRFEVTLEVKGHSFAVTALAVLPDGRLASGSRDLTIKLWNPIEGKLEATSEEYCGVVTALTVLPDGRLASGGHAYDGSEGTIKLWDPVNCKLMATLEGHTRRVTSLAVLPDGRLASGSEDCTIKVWSQINGELEATLQGHTGAVTALAVLPDGRLASGSGSGGGWRLKDGTIKLWNSINGQLEGTLEGHTGTVTALTALADGRLASGSRDCTIKLWNEIDPPKRTPILWKKGVPKWASIEHRTRRNSGLA